MGLQRERKRDSVDQPEHFITQSKSPARFGRSGCCEDRGRFPMKPLIDLMKRRGRARYACPLILTMTGLLEAQNGAALYKERCASCHDSPQGRIPSIGAIKQMTGEAVYAAMVNGAMKTQASGLSTQQLISLLVYIAPAGIANPNPAFRKTCSGTAPLKPGASAWGGPWGGWSPSVTNSRYQDAKAAGLAAGEVPRLKLKWAFNLGAVTMARGQKPRRSRATNAVYLWARWQAMCTPSTQPAGASTGPLRRQRECGRVSLLEKWAGRPMVFPQSSSEIAAR